MITVALIKFPPYKNASLQKRSRTSSNNQYVKSNPIIIDNLISVVSKASIKIKFKSQMHKMIINKKY